MNPRIVIGVLAALAAGYYLTRPKPSSSGRSGNGNGGGGTGNGLGRGFISAFVLPVTAALCSQGSGLTDDVVLSYRGETQTWINPWKNFAEFFTPGGKTSNEQAFINRILGEYNRVRQAAPTLQSTLYRNYVNQKLAELQNPIGSIQLAVGQDFAQATPADLQQVSQLYPDVTNALRCAGSTVTADEFVARVNAAKRVATAATEGASTQARSRKGTRT